MTDANTKKSIPKWIWVVLVVLLVIIIGQQSKLQQLTNQIAINTAPSMTTDQVQDQLANTIQVTVTDDVLQAMLDEEIKKQATANPVTDLNIALENGFGVLTAEWDKGQTLTARIEPHETATNLHITEINATGAGVLNTAFENIARAALDVVLASFNTAYGSDLHHADIAAGSLHLYYIPQ